MTCTTYTFSVYSGDLSGELRFREEDAMVYPRFIPQPTGSRWPAGTALVVAVGYPGTAFSQLALRDK